MKRRKPSPKARRKSKSPSLLDLRLPAPRKRKPPTPEEEAELAKAAREFCERASSIGDPNVTYWGDEPYAERLYRIPRPSVAEQPKPGPLRDKPPELPPQKRYAPKSETAIAVLKGIFPQEDGRPSRQAVSDAELERKYHAECDRRGIHNNDRVKKTQLLRCAGRKKS